MYCTQHFPVKENFDSNWVSAALTLICIAYNTTLSCFLSFLIPDLNRITFKNSADQPTIIQIPENLLPMFMQKKEPLKLGKIAFTLPSYDQRV